MPVPTPHRDTHGVRPTAAAVVSAGPVRGENMRFVGRRPEAPALSSDDDPRTVVLSTPRAAVRGLPAAGGGRRWDGRPERHVRLLRAAASGPLDTASGQLGSSRLMPVRGSGCPRAGPRSVAKASPVQTRPARPRSVPWLEVQPELSGAALEVRRPPGGWWRRSMRTTGARYGR
jgi:hypothetical protein